MYNADNKTVVGTVAALRELADSLNLTKAQTTDLINRFTTAPVKDEQLV